MTEFSSPETKVPPLVGTLPPQCQKDIEIMRRSIRAAIRQEPPADPVSPG